MADDDWEQVQSEGSRNLEGGQPSLGRCTKITNLHDRLLKQEVDEKSGAPRDEKWHLDEEQLDLAAYEQLILTLPDSEQYLRSRERETFGYVTSKCGYSKRRQQEIFNGVTRGAQRAQFEEELIDAVEQDDSCAGWLLKAGEKKKGVKGGAFKRRWFELQADEISYAEKRGGKIKGTIDLKTATSIESTPMEPLVFHVVLPTRKFQLKAEDPFEAQSWVQTLTRIISNNQEAKEGMLEKQGAKNKSFKERWFRILGTKMYYYKSPAGQDLKPAGIIDLTGATSCKASKGGGCSNQMMNVPLKVTNFVLKMADFGAEDPEQKEFSIGIDGRNYVLRATDLPDRDGWIADISRRCPALEGMDGFLIRYGKRGKKGKKGKQRWFKLLGKRLLYFKQPGAKHEEGEVPLDFARSCRPADAEDDTEFEIEMPKDTFRMKAETPEACREWITAISEAITSEASGEDDGAEYDDADMPMTHLMCHRWLLLKEKRNEDFESVGEFLQWRKRQLVLLGSGLHHQIDHLRESRIRDSDLVSADGALDKAEKALKVIRNIIEASKLDLVDWSGQDDREWQKRLDDLQRNLDDVFVSDENVPLSEWGGGDVPTYICHYPLHLGTLFVERLLRKACFEEEDFGGGLDFQRDNVDELLRHMGARLKFVEGLHEVAFSCALVEQYSLLVRADVDPDCYQEVVEVLAEEIEAIDSGDPALKTMAAGVCLLHVQKFSMKTLSAYHDLADSTYIAHFVKVFSEIMRLRNQVQEEIQKRMEAQITASVDKRYRDFWSGAIAGVTERAGGGPQYDDEGERVDPEVPDEGDLNPLEILQEFCDIMTAEIDQEVGEYAAYIGTCMENPDDASIRVVKTIAEKLNTDVRAAFGNVEEMNETVMVCWGSLRELEEKMVGVMLSCGLEGRDAKLLHVDEALVKVAFGWMDDKEKQFNERMNNSIEQESWEPFNDNATFAACAVDMVSMLISVAKQYFAAELPVSALIKVDKMERPVWDDADAGDGCVEKAAIRILADKFGLSLQKFGRKVLQQCGDEPRPPWRQEKKRNRAATMMTANLGGLGKGLTGMRKTIGDEGTEEEPEEEAVAIEDGVSVEGMCIRMSTINYVADHCKDMCNELEMGCQQSMYNAKWVRPAVAERELELKKMVRTLADICSAKIVFEKLNLTLYDIAYKPLPSAAPVIGSELFDDLEEHLGTVMSTVPDECYLEFKRASGTEAEDVALREIILEQMLTNIVAVLCNTIGGFRGARLIELTAIPGEDEEDAEETFEDVDRTPEVEKDIAPEDAKELAEYFVAGGEGLSEDVANKVTEKLTETWENVKGEAVYAKKSGKTAKELDKEARKAGGPDSVAGAAAALTGGVGGLTKGLGASMLGKKKEEEFKASGFFDDDDEEEKTYTEALGGLATGLTAGLTSGLGGASNAGAQLSAGLTDGAFAMAGEVTEHEEELMMRDEKKVTIPARARNTYRVPVMSMMGPVMFYFTIVKSEINFSVKFVPTGGEAAEIDGWEDGLREAGPQLKGMYAPEKDGELELEFDNSRSLMTTISVEFKVQLLSDTMAEAMAMQDEGPMDEEEIEARTQIKTKRGRFGTLGKMGGKMGGMTKGATQAAADKAQAAAALAADKSKEAASAASNIKELDRSSLTTLGERASVSGGASAGLGLVKGVGGGALNVTKGVGGGALGVTKGVGSRARRASVQGAKLGGGLAGRVSGGSADGEQEGDEDGSNLFPDRESIVEEGEPPESPPAGAESELAPPEPVAPAPKPPGEPAPAPAPKPPKKSAPKKPASKPVPAGTSVPQIKLQVEPSDGGATEAKEISVPAANDGVPSLIKAVGVALGANVTEVSIWDDGFEEFAVLEDIGDLQGGAKVEVKVS